MLKYEPTISVLYFQDEALFSSVYPCDTLLSITDQYNQNIFPIAGGADISPPQSWSYWVPVVLEALSDP